MSKVDLARKMIEGRIAHADYVLEGLPAERQLAQELGLSRATVRMALQDLTRDGTLSRLENGRLNVVAAGKAQKPSRLQRSSALLSMSNSGAMA